MKIIDFFFKNFNLIVGSLMLAAIWSKKYVRFAVNGLDVYGIAFIVSTIIVLVWLRMLDLER